MATIRFSTIPLDSESTHWRLLGEKNHRSLAAGIGEDDLDLGEIKRKFNIAIDEAKVDAHLRNLETAIGFGDRSKPIVCFVHGFQFDPRIEPTGVDGKSANPHVQLYRYSETRLKSGDDGIPGSEEEHDSHSTPWLKRASDNPEAAEFPGLAIAFGYESWGNELNEPNPSVFDFWRAMSNIDLQEGRHRNIYAQAYYDAENAAASLAGLIDRFDRRLGETDDRKIDLFAHSLGTRTVLLALQRLARSYPRSRALDRVGNVIMLAGSASWIVGARVLRDIQMSGAHHMPSFFNFPSSEDAVIQLLGSRAALRTAADSANLSMSGISSFFRFIKGGEMIGREGRPDPSIVDPKLEPYEDWVDVQLDNADVKRWAKNRHRIDLKGARKGVFEMLDHWVHYTHPGNWDLYRAILYDRQNWTTKEIRTQMKRYRS